MKDSLLIQPQSGVGSRQSGLEAKRALSMNKESHNDTYEKDSARFSEKFKDTSKATLSSKKDDKSSSSDLNSTSTEDDVTEISSAIEIAFASESEAHALGETLVAETQTGHLETHEFLTIKVAADEIDLAEVETSLHAESQGELLNREITNDIIQISVGGDSQANAAQLVQAIAANGNAQASSDNIGEGGSEASDGTVDLLSSSDLRDVEVDSIDTDTSEAQSDLLRRETINAPSFINSGLAFEHGQLFPNATLTNGTPLFGLGIESQTTVNLSGQSLIGPSAAASTPKVANAITNTVAQAILTAKETPQGVMVQLDPPEMGRVYIDFMFDGDNAVTVVVKADSAESHAILRERSEQFMQMLAENGFENVNLSFEQQGSQKDDGSQEAFENGRHLDITTDQPINDIVTSYENPIYRVNEDQLRLDLKI